MGVKDEYVEFKTQNNLKPSLFEDRVKLQLFLRGRIDDIWAEMHGFSNSGLFANHMTGFAIGFAYYDCRPSPFCITRCYGLRIAGNFDYYMLRLAVITSESLKTRDPRYLEPLSKKIRGLKCLKIGHWGDAVPEQVPVIGDLAKENPKTAFWWYTRKREVGLAANSLDLPNLKAYLSLDPTTNYPSKKEYPYGLTYLVAEGLYHEHHEDILEDGRLVAVFARKMGSAIEDLDDHSAARHPKMCEEKKRASKGLPKTRGVCLSCAGRCNFRRT